MINDVTLQGAAAAATVVGGITVWLWRTATSVSKAGIELGICRSDVAKLQDQTQRLHDQGIRTDVTLTTITAKLDKLDKVDALVTSVESMRAIVERIDVAWVPRAEIEARLRPLEDSRHG